MTQRISYKLISAVSGVIVVAFSSFSFLIIRSHQNNLQHRVQESARQLSETVRTGTKYYMLRNSRDDLHRAIDAIAAQDGIERIRVINKEGEITFSSDPAEIDTTVNKTAEACYACHAVNKPLEHLNSPERTRIFTGKDGVRNLGIINPIYNEERCYNAACHAHERPRRRGCDRPFFLGFDVEGK